MSMMRSERISRKVKCIVIGIVLVVVGIGMLYVDFTVFLGDMEGFILSGIMGVVLLGFGVICLATPYYEEQQLIKQSKPWLKKEKKRKEGKPVRKNMTMKQVVMCHNKTMTTIIGIGIFAAIMINAILLKNEGLFVLGLIVAVGLITTVSLSEEFSALKRYIYDMNMNYKDIDEDFRQGLLYKQLSFLICVGSKYIVYVGGATAFVIRVSYITKVKNTTMVKYDSNMASGKITTYKITVETKNKQTFTIPCTEFNIECVIESIKKSCDNLVKESI